MLNYFIYETKIGKLLIIGDQETIYRIDAIDASFDNAINGESDIMKKAIKQINEYLDGKRYSFAFPISVNGTQFQKQIWQILQSIPYGETKTYKQIATIYGNAKASRAVGNAINKNPILIVIPCHRVIGSNNALVGFRAGLEMKQRLLMLEKR